MKQLEVWYKKNTDFTYSIVKKSALESNMFTRKRVTLEGMIKAKNMNKEKQSKFKEEMNGIFQTKNVEGNKKKINTQKEIGILSLLQDKDIQNYRKRDLGEPTGRREVELLNEWLDQMLNQYVFSKTEIKKDADRRKEALYHAKLILSICLRDLIRQVSVQ